MKAESEAQRARTIAESLNKAFFHHGYPVGRKEAKEIGLPVAEPNEQVESLIWKIWQDVEQELKIRKPFSAHFELMASAEGAKLLAPVQQLNLPANAPPQVVQQMLQQLTQNAVVDINPVDFELITTVMESCRHASREMLRGKVLAIRMPDLNLRVNAVTTQAGWEQMNVPAQAARKRK